MAAGHAVLAALVWCLSIQAYSDTPSIAVSSGTAIPDVARAVHQSNVGQKALRNIEMPEALPRITGKTTTNWTEGVKSFTGPTLSTVFAFVPVEPRKITVYPAYDYKVTLPLGSVGHEFLTLSTRRGGLPSSWRDFGPIWLNYPYDLSDGYRTNLIYSQSVGPLGDIIFRQA